MTHMWCAYGEKYGVQYTLTSVFSVLCMPVQGYTPVDGICYTEDYIPYGVIVVVHLVC